MSESTMAANVVRWLESCGWDVYQEVQWHGWRADIVAVMGRRLWVVECKTSLTWTVVEQGEYVQEMSRPALNRKADTATIIDTLTPQHKTFAMAGNADGKFWSPFKETCLDVQRAVHQEPGINLKTLIDRVTHHYKTNSIARACISKWAQAGKIPGIECRIDGRNLTFHPIRSGVLT